jgi:hypothetical protein
MVYFDVSHPGYESFAVADSENETHTMQQTFVQELETQRMRMCSK